MKELSQQASEPWWAIELSALLDNLEVDPDQGLSQKTIESSREQYGTNTIEEIKPTSTFDLILEGLREPMMLVLLAIASLSFIFGKSAEALVMLFVVVAYITVEFINKYRSDRTMTKLRQLTQPTATVIRNGTTQEIPTHDMVVGDVLILTEGVRVPVDGRLVESYGLVINEAPLTGESLPVKKDATIEVHKETPFADRKNSVFSGTLVMDGEGKAIVCAVGQASELGKITQKLVKVGEEKTVLQTTMTSFAKTLAMFALFVSALIPAVGIFRGFDLQEMIVTWLALTFLMIPGQPPVIITMALALASFSLAKNQLVIKRLRGVEILAQVTTIVTDKTGTITENKMQVDTFILADGQAYTPSELDEEMKHDILLALPQYSNDPTDLAVHSAVANSEDIPQPVTFSGFDEDTPWRTIGYKINDKKISYLAGKAEPMLDHVSNVFNCEALHNQLNQEVEQGKRVVAYGRLSNSDNTDEIELLALGVLSDPIRNNVKQSIQKLKAAEVQTYIVTGDHPATARRVAKDIGIETQLLTGQDIEKMDQSELIIELETTRVFARITPSQKLRIVEALQQQDEVVAVLGDGINDAPALKSADVGIAMGEIGTDLAKETADVVLADDNYTHVSDALEISRSALDNFRKGLTYYLTAKAILLSIFLIPLLLGIPFPFAPIHIIITELLMDLASSTIFVTESPEPDIMKQPTKDPKDFLGQDLVVRIFKNGTALTLGIIALYLGVYFQTNNLILAQTVAFVTWLLGHILLALNLKQEKLPLLQQGLFSNRFGTLWLLGMMLFSIVITSVPALNTYLKTAPLDVTLWVLILATIIVSTFWIEAVKLIRSKEELN